MKDIIKQLERTQPNDEVIIKKLFFELLFFNLDQ